MANPFDELVQKYRGERDQAQQRLDELKLERGVLDDVLEDPQKWDHHPAAMDRQDQLVGQLTEAQAQLAKSENDLVISQNARAMFPGPQDGVAGRGAQADMREEAMKDEVVRDEEDKARFSQGIDVLTIKEAPAADVIQVAMGHTQHETGTLVPPPDQARPPPVDEFNLPVAVALVAAVAHKKFIQEPREAKAQADEGRAKECQAGQLGEISSFQKNVVPQHEALTKEAAMLSLDDAARDQLWKTELDSQSDKAKDMFAQHKAKMDALGGHRSAEAVQKMEQAQDGLKTEICGVEATRQIKTANEALVQQYADKRSPSPEQLSNYDQQLASSAPAEISVRTEELKAQQFPPLEREGPDLGSGPQLDDR